MCAICSTSRPRSHSCRSSGSTVAVPAVAAAGTGTAAVGVMDINMCGSSIGKQMVNAAGRFCRVDSGASTAIGCLKRPVYSHTCEVTKKCMLQPLRAPVSVDQYSSWTRPGDYSCEGVMGMSSRRGSSSGTSSSRSRSRGPSLSRSRGRRRRHLRVVALSV